MSPHSSHRHLVARGFASLAVALAALGAAAWPVSAVAPSERPSAAGPGAATSPAKPGLQAVLGLLARTEGRQRFKGVRVQQCVRQDMVLDARARIDHLDGQNYQIALTGPKELDGLSLLLERNQLTAFFPREALLFQSDVSATGEEVRDLVLGRVTTDVEALQRHYRLSVAPETDIVALYPCWRVTAEPVGGYGPESPPGRRFWVARETGLVMKEERFWGPADAAYFTSRYESVSFVGKPSIGISPPKGVSRLRLEAGSPTEMRRFPTPEAARAAGKAVALPTAVPATFKLRAVDVMTLYGTDLVFLRYDDGLSHVVVTYRTKPNMFLTLVAGAFALALVEKISALSYHAPNNYAVVEKGDYLVYAYGDLYQDVLKGMAQSVPLGPTPRAGGQ
ncbi:MAG: hypothetical protein VKQ33_05320 [Candidatus Sericytochromatia bacterium]|nr:hypothetical protein [Candidatus Sericytochromatia bacterium]